MTHGTVGMYGGKFLPCPHMGHVYAMIRASTMVDELHVVVSYDEEHEKKLCEGGKVGHVPYGVRTRWWKRLTRDMPHVRVHAIEEKQTGRFSDWKRGAAAIKTAVGKPIDAVFSSEHAYTKTFERLYPGAAHMLIDPDRKAYPISGTKLRTEGVMKHWCMLPDAVKPYFAKKVVVVGTESCGKSTLVRNLAALYNTTYVAEFGRTYFERLGDYDTLPDDYPLIAFEHKCHEQAELARANKVLFVDTEAVVTQYYSLLYLNRRNPVVDAVAGMQSYDAWLLLEPDVEWVDDGTRKHGDAETRRNNHEQLKKMLDDFGISYHTVSGNYEERLERSMRIVDRLLEIESR